MADIFVPLLLGVIVAIPIVVIIRMLRSRSAHQQPPTPEPYDDHLPGVAGFLDVAH